MNQVSAWDAMPSDACLTCHARAATFSSTCEVMNAFRNEGAKEWMEMPQDLMFGAAWSLPQLLIVLLLVVLLFGKGKVSDLMGDVAKGIKSFKKGLADEDFPAPPQSRRPRPRRSRSITNQPGQKQKRRREQRRKRKSFRSIASDFLRAAVLHVRYRVV